MRWRSMVGSLAVAVAVAVAMGGGVTACAPDADVVVTDVRTGTPVTADTVAPPDDSRPPLSQPEVTAPEGSDTTDTTETPAVDEDDVDLVVALWSGYDEAVADGVETKVAYIVEHAYPDLELTEAQCAEDPDEEGYVLVTGAEVELASIEPDPDWTVEIPGSPMEGLTPDGTIYVHDVTLTYEDGSADTAPAHTAIVDGTAYFFFSCAG